MRHIHNNLVRKSTFTWRTETYLNEFRRYFISVQTSYFYIFWKSHKFQMNIILATKLKVSQSDNNWLSFAAMYPRTFQIWTNQQFLFFTRNIKRRNSPLISCREISFVGRSSAAHLLRFPSDRKRASSWSERVSIGPLSSFAFSIRPA